MKYLIIVDMQKDFINGSLGTEEAEKIVPEVIKKIKEFDGTILATRDTHGEDYLDTQEGKKLPVVHCIKGSAGWELPEEIKCLIKEPPIDKETFGSTELPKWLKNYEKQQEKIDSITLVGLCTDICVISNAMILKAYYPEIPIIVDASCCAGVTTESHRQALSAMKMCQIEVTNEKA